MCGSACCVLPLFLSLCDPVSPHVAPVPSGRHSHGFMNWSINVILPVDLHLFALRTDHMATKIIKLLINWICLFFVTKIVFFLIYLNCEVNLKCKCSCCLFLYCFDKHQTISISYLMTYRVKIEINLLCPITAPVKGENRCETHKFFKK